MLVRARISAPRLTQLITRSFAGDLNMPDTENYKEKFRKEEILANEEFNFYSRHFAPKIDEKRSLNYKLKNLEKPKAISLLQWLQSNFDMITPERACVDIYNPPKLTDNSVFLHQSEKIGTLLRHSKKIELPLWFGALMTSSSTAFFGGFAALAYYWYFNARYYEVARRLVVRMDLLPNLEAVNIQKLDYIGRITHRIVRITDLEKVEFNLEKENYFHYLNKDLIDFNLIFKDKTSGEIFMFDRRGVWDWNNIGHELIY